MKVIGIMLVHNEDRFIEASLRNVIDFCDELIVVDHDSDDGTPSILQHLSDEFAPKIRVVPTHDTADSHRLLEMYAGLDVWVFGVDGDEIYDPEGLARLRSRLDAGEFNNWWVIFGNVLNVKSLARDFQSASGHLAPPSRSMTKLYNFAAIDSWTGNCIERLHGGDIQFRENYNATLRCALHESVDWDDADFRCLHLCFLKRSSSDAPGVTTRKNIMDLHAWSWEKMVRRIKERFFGQESVDWKEEKYARGPVVKKDVTVFFPQFEEDS